MGNLTELYTSIEKNVFRVYVFPRIQQASHWNPYLSNLYKGHLSSSDSSTTFHCESPHPLAPQFILRRALGEKSIVHYHWLEFSDLFGLITLIWKLILLCMYKLCGGNIVWTIHNKRPHRNKYYTLNRLFSLGMASIADTLHVHSEESISLLSRFLSVSKSKFYVIAHPPYTVSLIDKEASRNELQSSWGIRIDNSKPLFLMYGSIAPYKGTIAVADIAVQLDLQLILAGETKKGDEYYINQVNKCIKNHSSVFLKNQFISLKEEQLLMSAADYVIFNFSDLLSSGSVVLAQSYKKRIIIPDSHLIKTTKGTALYTFKSKEELISLLQQITDKGPLTKI